MMVVVTLVASLLVVAASQVSDMAAITKFKGFLFKYAEDLSAYSGGADASKTSNGNYNQFITPNLYSVKSGSGPGTLSHHSKPDDHGPVDGIPTSSTADRPFITLDNKLFHTTAPMMSMLSTKDHGTLDVLDRKAENLEVEKMLGSQKANTDIGLVTIAMTLLACATALAVRFRREGRPVPVLATAAGPGSDMFRPASDDPALELKSQGSTINGEGKSRQRFEVTVGGTEAQPPSQEDRGSSSASSNLMETVALLVDADCISIDAIKAALKAAGAWQISEHHDLCQPW